MTDQDIIISLNNVSIAYNYNILLEDINFEVKRGDFFFLIGKTGSGKSSLLKILYADLPLLYGKGSVVNFNLENLKKTQIPYLRRKLGIVFQDFQLLTDRNVEENLIFVLKATGWKDKKKIYKRVHEVIYQVGLISSLKKMPHQLSGGEQQRVVIARAILNNPEVILADEPTGNLDPYISDEIIELFQTINKTGTAVIMATHNYKYLENKDTKILHFQDGKVIQKKN